jgi:hypothetical protein
MIRIVASILLAVLASPVHAYCVYNEIDREVAVTQERHPSSMRDERKLHATLAPGAHVCCERRNLDCNPEGRANGIVNLEMRILGEPRYVCGFPAGREPDVKVTGAGTIRIQRNPRKSAFPYVVRVRTHDGKNVTGPRGLACTEPKTKGNP